MRGKDRERWLELCEQAAIEQDPQRLLELVKEIDRLLGEKQRRLHGVEGAAPAGTCGSSD